MPTSDTFSVDGVGVLLMGTGNDNNTWGVLPDRIPDMPEKHAISRR
jgi:hypothetical protein